MAHPSFALNAPPVLCPGSINGAVADYDMNMTFWTSSGRTLIVQRRVTLANPMTAASAYAWATAMSTSIEAAEQAAITAAQVAPVSPLAPFVGIRYDATAAMGTVLAPANTPAATSGAPLGGG